MLDIENAKEIQILPIPNFIFEFNEYVIKFNWRKGVIYASFMRDNIDIVNGRLMAYNESVEIENYTFMLFNPYLTDTFPWTGLGSEIKLLYSKKQGTA